VLNVCKMHKEHHIISNNDKLKEQFHMVNKLYYDENVSLMMNSLLTNKIAKIVLDRESWTRFVSLLISIYTFSTVGYIYIMTLKLFYNEYKNRRWLVENSPNEKVRYSGNSSHCGREININTRLLNILSTHDRFSC
jgi:hypothetical protein